MLWLYVALPICVLVLALRSQHLAKRRGQDADTVGLAVRMWAYQQVLAPIVLALVILAFLVAAILTN